MDILQSTRQYEKWMASQTSVVKADLIYKHKQMKGAIFPFLRATFYRWVQLWNDHCNEIAIAPRVLGVGDLHVENFGTWRDAEGRLIWGINDFDEACELPYTNDLVRLTTSVQLAVRDEHLKIRFREAAELILEGYSQTLRRGGRPFVLDEEHQFLRNIALAKLRDPVHFWGGMRSLPQFNGTLSQDQRNALEVLLPHPIPPYDVVTRRAGLGSLGRVRLVAVTAWGGGLLAREIKSFLPSAWNLHRSLYPEILVKAVRMPDPFVRIFGKWVVRRLAPDCSRIELTSLPKKRDEAHLLHAMGSETANIHLGTQETVKAIRRDLDHRPASWLYDAAKRMSKALTEDWEVFAHS